MDLFTDKSPPWTQAGLWTRMSPPWWTPLGQKSAQDTALEKLGVPEVTITVSTNVEF